MSPTATPTTALPDAHRQAKYQVRFDWGVTGAAAVAGDADVVVWVDALPGDDVDAPAGGMAGPVLHADLTNPSAVAAWVLDEQVRLGRRAMVAVIAAGGAPTPTPRFTVEDLLAAGAVIDALAARGIDYSSPEAAAACAAFTGLRRAVGHLLTASASGQERLAAGVPAADIAALGRLDSSSDVHILRGPAEQE